MTLYRPEILMRPGVAPHSHPTKPPLPPLEHAQETWGEIVIERNAPVRLRDGTTIYADLYRPAGGRQDLPILLAWGPYGKHWLSDQCYAPHSGVQDGWLSPLTPFEGPDPGHWCPRGYGVAIVDPRGSWLSEGDFHHNGHQEAEDCYDTVQWLGELPWSNGKVGMSGVSYLAAIQYYVAPLHPPALAALNPWEGFVDWYREFAYHGGIRETNFLPRASGNIAYSLGRAEDTLANTRNRPLYDDFWASKEVDLAAITQPAYVVASWADQGFHSRGTLEVFKGISSKHKWLDAHGQKKWANYYRPESVRRQEAFFDHFLKERGAVVPAWPRVRIEVRERFGVATERAENEWPLARTEHTPWWLGEGTLVDTRAAGEAEVRYDATEGCAVFDRTFEQDVELTGHMKLRLWVEADGSNDMDLFVALQKLDANGEHVGFGFYAFYENGPVALGWLRASHRALDPERSTEAQPFHPHDREEPLERGVPAPVDIEIWPSSTLFRAGETLRVVVQGSDIYQDALPGLPFARHEETRNAGTHIIRFGGRYDSHLLAAVVPSVDG